MSLKEFTILNKLGDGAYSTVYHYALKQVKIANLSEKEKNNALNEIRILASIKNNNIISYKQAFFDQPSQSLCIVMEFADDGDLFQKITENAQNGSYFHEDDIWLVFIQIANGLRALHSLNIFHRDLKSANVFLQKDFNAKLGDMNVSKIAKRGLLLTQTGTPYYASPEVWRDMPYDDKSDIWSLGCVLYEMIALKPPFKADDMEGLYKKVIKGQFAKIDARYSLELNQVLKSLLQVSPNLRPSAQQILTMPQVQKKITQNSLPISFQNPLLLHTLKVPSNLNMFSEILPKPMYDEQEKNDELDIQSLQIQNKCSFVGTDQKLPRIGKKNFSQGLTKGMHSNHKKHTEEKAKQSNCFSINSGEPPFIMELKGACSFNYLDDQFNPSTQINNNHNIKKRLKRGKFAFQSQNLLDRKHLTRLHLDIEGNQIAQYQLAKNQCTESGHEEFSQFLPLVNKKVESKGNSIQALTKFEQIKKGHFKVLQNQLCDN